MNEVAGATGEAGCMAGVNIGEFHLNAASGKGWTYRMYLHRPDTVRVNRVFPDPDSGRDVALAERLGQYDKQRARFTFPSAWEANGNAKRAEIAIVNAYQRATLVPVAASIRFGDLVLVMTADPPAGIVRVEEEREGVPPRWAATLSALHKDPKQVQVAWSAPQFGEVFGTNPESEPGRSNRLRLARSASALWRSTTRRNRNVVRQGRSNDINEPSALLDA